jgi:glutathione S-transferase
MKLAYTALSPYCRKVRMAMEYKKLDFEIVTADHVNEVPAFNPRAEVPVLIDGDFVVCNSPDILGYLDRKFPERPVYPAGAREYAEVREWERFADTQVDPIMTVIGNWKFAELPAMPDGLLGAARRDLQPMYDRIEAQLANREYLCGAISAADFALYPQVGSGAALGLTLDRTRHRSVYGWLRRMRDCAEGQSDLAAAREWWANREQKTTDTERVNWGTFRLEWLLANGGVEFFVDQVRRDKVLWSVGPNNNARNSPAAPEWVKKADS